MLNKENISDIYALSSMQEGILFHTLLEQQSSAYFQQSAFLIKGNLNIAALEKALQQLLERHDVLRTVFKFEKVELPIQIVLKKWEAVFTYHDIRDTNAEEKAAFITSFKTSERAKHFNLSTETMMRVAVIQLDQTTFNLVWSYHHIILDGWSLRILMSEFMQLYILINEQKVISLPAATPFKEYIRWLEKQNKEEAGAYWQRYLKGYDEATVLPCRRSLTQQASGYCRAQVKAVLEEEITTALRSLAAQHHTTLYVLLQSVWGILLSKLTANQEVIFGSVVAGRPAELRNAEQMVGLFINTVPTRIHADPDVTFDILLKQVNEQLTESHNHDYFPFGEIVSLSPLKQHLIDHLLVLIEFPELESDAVTTGSELNITLEDNFEQTNYDLCVDITAGKKLAVEFTYNANAFEDAFIGRAAKMFTNLLDQVVKHPRTKIAELSVFMDHDRQMMEKFNSTDVSLPTTQSVTAIIEGFAASQPEHIALLYRGRQFSYNELNIAANQLAALMRQKTALKTDDKVGILMDRSDHMIISIIATWKCGAAYIPLDIDYPDDRLLLMLADAGAKMVLTDHTFENTVLSARLQEDYSVIDLDESAEALATCNTQNPGYVNHPSELAYIIYTSGSTGKPKGAMVEHGGMMNHLFAKLSDMQVTANSIVVQNASQCFDISVWQFFVALMAGGKTAVYGRELVLDPVSFMQQLTLDKITILELVPSYLSILLGLIDDGIEPPEFPELKYLVMTGEALKPKLVNRWLTLYPAIPMINAYGPTEASDDITHYLINKSLQVDTVPVGFPIQNTKIYIVDQHFQQCPVGIKGEIVVSGAGVGRGYVNDEVKTAGVFRFDPFREEKNIRLYQTGDVGRFLENGAVEFFGRKDYQVKIRGFRIELEEIEKAIGLFPFIEDAIVFDKQEIDGDTYLSAYLVVKEGYDTESLRAFLVSRLPDYMIPLYFTVLDTFPLTANGKTDRKTIREMAESAPLLKQSEFNHPVNETEEKLVAIWQGVLKMEKVSVTDNFFEIGGDSFKAIRMVSKFGRAFMVSDLYKYPTIRSLAAYISQNSQESMYNLYELTPAISKKKMSIIAVPNSAGDPLIYEETTKALLALTDEIAVYGVNLPRFEPSAEEPMQSLLLQLSSAIVEEVKKRIATPIIIYGQCNGAGLAIEIGRMLQDEGIICHAICTGGALPRTKQVSEADDRTDKVLVSFLESIDATFPTELEDQLIFFRNLKYDGVLAKAAFNYHLNLMNENNYNRLKAPFYVIVGDRDPITRGYHRKYKDWRLYAENVTLVEMPDVGHFMWRDQPVELAAILYQIAQGSFVAAPVKNKWLMFN
ncbi:amino acid adenylation domain-containing protein [Pedobacter mendelii]|uniref:amino acid adenylation domain-containing protein n=1 Tax=Pedobacter mendelii TaxID=1908240 RepID=UPI003607A734